MTAPSNCERILEVLAEGPATADELAVSTGLYARLVNAHLSHLLAQGTVVRRPFHQLGNGRGTRTWVWLWALPDYPPLPAHAGQSIYATSLEAIAA